MLSTKMIRSLTRTTARHLHTTPSLLSTTELTMPALSPTMTEGSVTSWKFQVGESFRAGDVLLQIETDKASIEVEAQDDGIMGMILVENDTPGVQVGAIIALLIEEGDDINSLKAPIASTSSSAPPPSTPSPPSPSPTTTTKSPPPPSSSIATSPSVTPPTAPSPSPSPSPSSSSSNKNLLTLTHPHHPQPLLPSVNRLLVLNGIEDASIIKATGSKGLLTKGDVLIYLGKIEAVKEVKEEKKVEKKVDDVKLLGGGEIRRLIAVGLCSSRNKKVVVEEEVPGFDEILNEYLPKSMRSDYTSTSSVSNKGLILEKKISFDNFLDL